MSGGLASDETANSCCSFARGQFGTAPHLPASTHTDYLLPVQACCCDPHIVEGHLLLLTDVCNDLQACTQEFCPARSLSAHCSLSHLENISEEHLQSNCQQPTCSQGQRQSSTEEQAPVFPKEKFFEEISYVSPALRRQSLQGSCSLPTVFSGQLV